jgi:hypothetical protein
MKTQIVAALALAVTGCLGQADPGSKTHSPSANTSPISTGVTDDMGPPASNVTPPAADMANGDALVCGGMQFALQRVAPNVMLVLDRSGSMNQAIAANSATTKYADLTAAIDNLATTYGSQMQLGDTFFAADNDCAAGVPGKILPNNGATIMSDVANHSPGSNTPTAATMQAVIDSKELTDPTRANYVILATDGLPNCADTDVTTRINTLYSQTPSVKTFIIGIGADTNTDPTQLNAWADAGHTARTGATHYYQTNSPADLKAAFDSIVGSVASCDFKMMQNAPDPSLINVTLDGAAVPNDPTNGYTFDGSSDTVSLHGTACSKLQNDASTKVGVVYGCPPPANPPPIT